MSRYKYTLIVLCLLCSCIAWSQDSLRYAYPKNQVKFNIYKVFDAYHPGIEIGYERKIHNHLSAHVAGAALRNTLGPAYDKYAGFRIVGEARYIPYPRAKKRAFYSPSISYVYNKMDITDVGGFVHDTTFIKIPRKDLYYKDTFSMRKETWAININGTFLLPINHFLLEVVGGVGVKHRNVTHTDRLYPADRFSPNRHNSEADAAVRVGNYYTVNMVLTVRVGYCF